MAFWLDLSPPPKATGAVNPFGEAEALTDPGGAPAGVDPVLYERLAAAYDKVLDGEELVLDEELAALSERLFGGATLDLDEQMTAYAFEPPAGVAPDSYWRMGDVANTVADRVTHCFAGSAWLRRRFPARSYVQMHLLTTDDASARVGYLTTEVWADGDAGPTGIVCGLQIPTSWMAAPGDGLLGLRLFQAVLDALRTIGEHYDIGMPAATRPRAGSGNPDVWDPFGPPPARRSYAEVNAHLERLAGSLRPDHLLLAVKEPISAGRCRTVRDALGTVIEQHTLPEAAAWTIQTRS